MIDFFSKIKSYGLLILGGIASILYLLLKHERNKNEKLSKENIEVKEINEVSKDAVSKKEKASANYRKAQDEINNISVQKTSSVSTNKPTSFITGNDDY